MIYLLIKKVGEDCELACDQRVISNKTFEQKKQYALTIANSVKYAINFEEKLENQYYIGLSNSKKLKIDCKIYLQKILKKDILFR